MKYLEIPAQIAKADITPTHAKIGSVNTDTFKLDGEPFAPGSLVFRGFAGRLDKKSGLYVGVYRFETSTAGVDSTPLAFGSLPKATAAKATNTKSAPVKEPK